MPYMSHTFPEFDAKLTETLRFAASMVEGFDEGAIVIRYTTESPAIAAWLNASKNDTPSSNGDNDDNTPSSNATTDTPIFSTESTSFIGLDAPRPPEPIAPHLTGKEYIAAAISSSMHSLATEEDLLVAKAHCSMLACERLDGCVYAVTHGYGRCSDDLPTEFTSWNRSNIPGAVCFDLYLPASEKGLIADDQLPAGERPMLRIYVSVLSRRAPESKWCAYQAIHAFHAFQQLLYTDNTDHQTANPDAPTTDLDCIIAPTYTPNFDEITFRHITN